jgi:hypothetical protein
VVAGLLERSSAEYAEGVTDGGEISEELDYWAADAYAAQAAQRYETRIRATVSAHAAEELDEMMESVTASIGERAAPEDVTTMVGSITGELGEYTGLEVESGSGDVATVERIETDLHEAVEAYENGDPAGAKSIIKQTYLSNFEGIEGTLIEERPELVETLEGDFNDDLPGLIEENASVSAVREKVVSMEERLHEAEEILAAHSETEIDLEKAEETTAIETTATETPGFGVLGAAIAVGLLALLGYRTGN